LKHQNILTLYDSHVNAVSTRDHSLRFIVCVHINSHIHLAFVRNYILLSRCIQMNTCSCAVHVESHSSGA